MDAPDVPPPDPQLTPTTSPRALIVDDDPGSCSDWPSWSKREGFVVASAGSLRQAREEIAANPPDILLVDLYLPDGSGLDLLDGFAPGAAPEVVLITGNATVETAVEALAPRRQRLPDQARRFRPGQDGPGQPDAHAGDEGLRSERCAASCASWAASGR